MNNDAFTSTSIETVGHCTKLVFYILGLRCYAGQWKEQDASDKAHTRETEKMYSECAV